MRSRDEVLGKSQPFCSDIGSPSMVFSGGAEKFTSSDFRSSVGSVEQEMKHRHSIPRRRVGKLKEFGEQRLE